MKKPQDFVLAQVVEHCAMRLHDSLFPEQAGKFLTQEDTVQIGMRRMATVVLLALWDFDDDFLCQFFKQEYPLPDVLNEITEFGWKEKH